MDFEAYIIHKMHVHKLKNSLYFQKKHLFLSYTPQYETISDEKPYKLNKNR